MASVRTSEVRQTLALLSARPGYFVGKKLEETHVHLAKAIWLSVIGQFTILIFQNVPTLESKQLLKGVSHAEAGKFCYYAGHNYTFGVTY
jgi:hypothetical protein